MIALLAAACGASRPTEIKSSVDMLALNRSAGAFDRATEPRAFDWPRDHAAHPSFATEWWYYTGNVHDAAGRAFGYQLTIFRNALVPPTFTQTVTSTFAFSQTYSAHFAISDIQERKHHAFEVFGRGAAGLAGTTAEPFRVWLYDWQIAGHMDMLANPDLDVARNAPGNVQLTARDGDFAIDLKLQTQKPMVLQGLDGYSPKGKNPGNASFYYSFTRMQTAGTITVSGTPFTVSGTSWMDHEWSTEFLDEDAIGWEWLSLQLDDGRDMLLAQVNNRDALDGSRAFVALVVDTDGRSQRFERADVRFTPADSWVSRTSGITYRTRWRVSLPASGIELTVAPAFDDQEARLSTTYYEGAMLASGSDKDGRPITGVGYLEITRLAQQPTSR